MQGLFKGHSTQCTTKPEHSQPRHQPSAQDQKAGERLRSKVSGVQAKFRGPAYIALRSTALNTVYETFYLGFPVFFHLPKIASETPPLLYVIQKYRHCISTSDNYYTSIHPNPMIILTQQANNSRPESQ